MSRALKARGRLGIAVRNRPDQVEERRADLAEAKILDYAEDVLATAPPLGPERLARIAAIFQAGGAA